MTRDNTSGSLFRLLFVSGSVLFVGKVFQMGANFATKLVLARALGPTEFGILTLGLTLMSTFSILVLMGMNVGVGRYLPRFDDPGRRRGVLVSAFKLVVPLSVALGGVLFASADVVARLVFDSAEVAPVVRTFGLLVPLAAFVHLTVGSVRGMKDALPRLYIRNVGLSSVLFISVLAAVALGFAAVGVAWAYAFAYSVAAVISLYYLARRTPLFDSVTPVPMYRELLWFSLPLMVTTAMNLVLSNVDIFMLGMFHTNDQVGMYNVVYSLALLLHMILTSFAFVFMPVISELHADGQRERMGRTYRIVSKWIFVATLPIALVFTFHPDVVIRNTFGPEYVDGGLALTLLTVGFLSHALAGPAGDTLTSMGKSKLIMYDNLLVAGVNVGLNLLLIPRYSIVGAAVATVAGYLLMNALYLGQLYRAIGVSPFRATLVLPVSVATGTWLAVYEVVMYLQIDALPVLVLTWGAFVVAYVGIFLAFGGVDVEEIELIEAFLDRSAYDLRRVEAVLDRLK